MNRQYSALRPHLLNRRDCRWAVVLHLDSVSATLVALGKSIDYKDCSDAGTTAPASEFLQSLRSNVS